MARGTSPQPRGTASIAWTAVASIVMRGTALLLAMSARRGRRLALSQIAASLYLAGVAMVTLTAWQLPDGGSTDTTSAIGKLHLILLLGIGSLIAVTALAGGDRLSPRALANGEAPGDSLGELMAHMSHALRTPLNAVIGFSDVMAHELHGPLGNSRYQEYALHIRESGGQLLKSSEDALAVTQAMTSLMTDRRRGRRDRVVVGALLREAWQAAAVADAPPISLSGCDALTVTCERRATTQALEHLFHRVMTLPATQTVEISARPHPACVLEIRVRGACSRNQAADCGDLHLILARLLLQTQGATLTCAGSETGWSAAVEFAT